MTAPIACAHRDARPHPPDAAEGNADYGPDRSLCDCVTPVITSCRNGWCAAGARGAAAGRVGGDVGSGRHPPTAAARRRRGAYRVEAVDTYSGVRTVQYREYAPPICPRPLRAARPARAREASSECRERRPLACCHPLRVRSPFSRPRRAPDFRRSGLAGPPVGHALQRRAPSGRLHHLRLQDPHLRRFDATPGAGGARAAPRSRRTPWRYSMRPTCSDLLASRPAWRARRATLLARGLRSTVTLLNRMAHQYSSSSPTNCVQAQART